VLEDGRQVVQVDNPVHIADMSALVLSEESADSMVSAADSRVAADFAR
jgi:hypothetical protein